MNNPSRRSTDTVHKFRGIHLLRTVDGRCVVSLDIEGKLVPVISDNGDVISHYAHRTGTVIDLTPGDFANAHY